MRNLVKPIFVLFTGTFLMLFLSNCSKSTDPVDNDFFVGNYTGNISYSDGTSNISNTATGKVFVTKIASGTHYNFGFSDNIPDLNGIVFRQDGDHILVSADATTSVYIRIDNNELKILYIKDGKTWTANCTR